MNKLRVSLVLNIINVIFVLFAVIAMMTGFHFMGDKTALELGGYNAFQFFTFDSNLLLGIVSAIFIVYEIMIIKGKTAKIPPVLYLFKFASTVAVSLTMLTVVIFLAPTFEGGYFILFANANLFFHLVCPLIAIVAFGLFEKPNEIKFKDCIYGVVPMFLYSIYYVIDVFTHMENGKVAPQHDWYGFAQGGTIGMILSVVIMFSGTYLISVLLYLLNKKVLTSKE